ncbi:hypothetical protein ACS0TY_023858 [Phlomoides rotata]
MKIKVKFSTMVKPMTEKPCTTLWISNIDALLPENYHTLTHYFYRSTGAVDFFDPAVLKAALSQALVEFYPVAGRLKKDKDRVEINCNGHGALFVEAESDSTLNDLGDFGPKTEITLIPKVDYSQGISTFPLLLVQVTRFKCGGVCLGIAMEHQLVDGISSIHFINTWSDIARGLDIAMPPYVDRRVLSAREPPQPEFSHVEYHPPPPLKALQDHNSKIPSEIIYSILKLTHDQLNVLKTHCQGDEGNKVKYTSFEVLTGHVWRCICKARGLPEDQESKLSIIVDGRSRLRPPLPPGYLGNAVFKTTHIASCGELESNPLKFIVSKVHEALARMNDDYLRSAIDYLEVKGGVDPNARGTGLYKSPNLGITSWARIPFSEADFGWGQPVYMGLGSVPAEGHFIVLPTPGNDGSVLLAMSMQKEQFQVFEKLFYQF